MASSTTSMKEEFRGQVGQAAEKGKDLAGNIGDMAGKAASAVSQTAGKAASAVSKTADKVTSAAGSGIKHLGETIGEHTPHEGIFGSASQAVAGTLKEGGKYLEEGKMSGMIDDAANLIRRNPVPAVLIGIGLGFLLGRLVRT